MTILTGVFDPPPDLLTVPWVYLILLAVAATASQWLLLLLVHV